MSLLLVFVRAQKQDAANKIHEQERTHAKRGGVALLALVNSPADDRHGKHPCERDDQKGAGDGRNKAQDEVNEAQCAIGIGHGVNRAIVCALIRRLAIRCLVCILIGVLLRGTGLGVVTLLRIGIGGGIAVLGAVWLRGRLVRRIARLRLRGSLGRARLCRVGADGHRRLWGIEGRCGSGGNGGGGFAYLGNQRRAAGFAEFRAFDRFFSAIRAVHDDGFLSGRAFQRESTRPIWRLLPLC